MANEDVVHINPAEVDFVQVTGSGGMGDLGSIYLIIKNEGGITAKRGSLADGFDIDAMFDKILPSAYAPHHIPEGWSWVDLGMGNNLFIRSEYYQDFRNMVEGKSRGGVYRCWMEVAEKLLKCK